MLLGDLKTSSPNISSRAAGIPVEHYLPWLLEPDCSGWVDISIPAGCGAGTPRGPGPGTSTWTFFFLFARHLAKSGDPGEKNTASHTL